MSNKSILFLLDASESMSSFRQITVGGFNAWKRTLELIENDVRVTLASFDHRPPIVVYDHVPARKIRDMTLADYNPIGYTALYDALKIEMKRIEKKHFRTGDTALVIMLTDGSDNESSTSPEQITQLIQEYRKKGWEFLYLSSAGGYQEYAARMGIGPEHCIYFSASEDGTEEAYQEITRASMSFANGEAEKLEDWAPVFEKELKETA